MSRFNNSKQNAAYGTRVKAAPVVKLQKVTYGQSSNWPVLSKQIVKDLEKEYGNAARFTEQIPGDAPINHYWQPLMPNPVGAEEDDGLDLDDDERSAMRKSVFKEKAQMVELRPKIFADIMNRLSEESEDVTKRHAEWNECYNQRCPSHLWQILVETHSIRADNNAAVVRRAHARVSYNTVKQFGGELLVSFRERFEYTYDSYVVAGNEALDDETKAMDFFVALDDQRYSEFKRKVNNEFAGEERDPYGNVMAVFLHVQSYTPVKPVGAYSISRNATVFYARENDGSSSGQDRKAARDLSHIRCYNCDMMGHYKNNCPEPVKVLMAGVLTTTRDLLGKCSVLNIKWYEVVLDSGAAISVMSPKLLDGIHECPAISITGVTDDPVVLNMRGSLGGLIDAYCNDQVNANILSFSELGRKYKISYNSEKSCFTVYNGDKCIVFNERNGLYVSDMRPVVCPGWKSVLPVFANYDDFSDMPDLQRCESSDSECDKDCDDESDVESVVDDSDIVDSGPSGVYSVVYSPRQKKGAEQARSLMHQLGYPSYSELQKLVKSANLLGSAVTSQDVAIASKIYGTPVAAVRGKFVKKPVVSTLPDVTLMEEPSVQSLAVDLIYVGNQGFMIGLSSPLCLLLSTAVLNERTESLQQCMLDMIQVMASRNFVVNRVEMEPAAAMSKLEYNLGPGVTTNVTGAGDHLPALDVRIRRVKELIRATLTTVPFVLPPSKTKYLVAYAVSRMNFRCTEGRDDSQAPFVAFTGRKVNMKRELGLVFGDLCECAVSGVVSNDALIGRTCSHIALCPTGNDSGSWVFWSLDTNMLVRRSRWVKMNIFPQLIIHAADAIAASETDNPDFDMGAHDEIGDETADMLKDGVFAHIINPECDIERSYDRVGVSNVNGVKKKRGRPRKVNVPIRESSSPPPNPAPSVDDTFNVVVGEAVAKEIDEPLGKAKADEICDIDEPPPVLSRDSSDSEDGSVGSSEMVLNLSIKKGKAKYGSLADSSILSELEQIVVDDPPKLKPVKRKDQSREDMRRAIMSFLFLKAKETPTGDFEKLKSRLVANGKQQDASLFPNKSSPTAKLDHILLVLALAAKFGCDCSVVDITGAYLEADWTNPVKQLVWLEKPMVDILVAKYPEYAEFVEPDGRMLTQAMKALYGCLESSRMWYDLLTSVLSDMGFEKTDIDPCVMVMHRDGRKLIVVIYVDDLLVVTEHTKDASFVLNGLMKRFKKVKCVSGNTSFDYLGMRVEMEDGAATLTMDGYEDTMLEMIPGLKSFKYPADERIFDVCVDSKLLSECESKIFHTVVAKLLYYSFRVKPEIGVAVSFLTTRVIAPTDDDMTKLVHVLGYIKGTKGRGRVLRIGDVAEGECMNNAMRVFGHIDAAFGSHQDGKSHTGVVVNVGNACVLSRSIKQRIVTKDSTEAEIVGCSDFVTDVISINEFLTGLGYLTSTPTVYQDNQSAMLMMTNGNGKDRTRHLRVRKQWVKEKNDTGEIRVVYKDTDNMLGDLMSKAKVGKQFVKMKNVVNGSDYED